VAILSKLISSLQCHRISRRSFHYKGKQFPVCARCTGVYLGQIIMILLILVGFRLNLLASILLMVPLFIDGAIQHFKLLESTNPRRLITGLMCGLGAINLYLFIFILILKYF